MKQFHVVMCASRNEKLQHDEWHKTIKTRACLVSLSLSLWSIFSLGACSSLTSLMARAWRIILGVSLSNISWCQYFSTMPFVPMAVAMCAALPPWCWHNCFWSCAFPCIGEALFFFKGKSTVVICHVILLTVNSHSNAWWSISKCVAGGSLQHHDSTPWRTWANATSKWTPWYWLQLNWRGSSAS